MSQPLHIATLPTSEQAMLTSVFYLLYLAISIAVTIWVARTLSKNGRLFLVRFFDGAEDLADSVNHMLVVGFYLLNVGYIAIALRYGDKPLDLETGITYLSTKIGLVLLILGAIHLANMYAISRWGCEWSQARTERV